MNTRFLSVLLLAAALGGCATAPQDGPTQFTVASFDGKANKDLHIPVKLHLPDTQAPNKPAVILMGGCDGSVSHGAHNLKNQLVAAGVVVAELQSMAPFGRHGSCQSNKLSGDVRATEAFKAREILVKRGLAAENNVGVLGFSHGGWSVIHAVFGDTSNYFGSKTPFAAGVAFYPHCPAAMNVGSLKLKSPALLMGGAADNWTPFAPCQHLAAMSKDISDPTIPLNLVEYPNASHSWDNVKGSRTMETEKGTVTLGWDKDASADSIDRAMKFFRSNLKF